MYCETCYYGPCGMLEFQVEETASSVEPVFTSKPKCPTMRDIRRIYTFPRTSSLRLFPRSLPSFLPSTARKSLTLW